MVGFVRYKGDLNYGQMSHGEILQKDCFFNENLRFFKIKYYIYIFNLKYFF